MLVAIGFDGDGDDSYLPPQQKKSTLLADNSAVNAALVALGVPTIMGSDYPSPNKRYNLLRQIAIALAGWSDVYNNECALLQSYGPYPGFENLTVFD